MGIGRLRAQFPTSSEPELLSIWLRQVTGENVDSDGLPRPLTTLSGVDEARDRHVEQVADYLRYISHDCTFCGLLFPPYLVLAVNPDNVDDWRNCHYRCCYQCATGQREDCVWYSKFSSLSPAILGQRGSLRNELYPDEKPAGWHVAIERDNDRYSKVYWRVLLEHCQVQMGSQASLSIRPPKDLRHHRHLRLVQALQQGTDGPPEHPQRC